MRKMMTEKRAETASQVEPELRAQLARRLAVAGTLVAVLLGVLALFDRFSQPAEEEEVTVYTRPVPVAPPKMLTQPVTPVEPQETLPAEAAATESTEPVTAGASETPPPPEVAATPSQPVRQPSAPATTKSEARNVAPTEPEVVPEMTAPPQLLPAAPTPRPAQAAPTVRPSAPATPSAAPSPSPSARVLTTTPAAARPSASETPAAPRLFSGFVLQAGVFASAQRAEELHARLTLNGVPSQIEARVQVGPFRTRREAAAAQAKLRELGIESMLVEPKGNR
jgi:DedD protein